MPLKKNKKESIIANKLDECYLCGSMASELHHIFFGNKQRDWSEKYSLKVPLCRHCHNLAHKYREINYMLKEIGQKTFEEKVGTRKEFMNIFGENYL